MVDRQSKIVRISVVLALVSISLVAVSGALLRGTADYYLDLVKEEIRVGVALNRSRFVAALDSAKFSVDLMPNHPRYQFNLGRLYEICSNFPSKCELDSESSRDLAQRAFQTSARLGSNSNEARIRYLLLKRDQAVFDATFHLELAKVFDAPLTGVAERVLLIYLVTTSWPILDVSAQQRASTLIQSALISEIKVVNQRAMSLVDQHADLLGAQFASRNIEFIRANPGKPAFGLIFAFWKHWGASQRLELIGLLADWAQHGYSGEIFVSAVRYNKMPLACTLISGGNRFDRYCTDKKLTKK